MERRRLPDGRPVAVSDDIVLLVAPVSYLAAERGGEGVAMVLLALLKHDRSLRHKLRID